MNILRIAVATNDHKTISRGMLGRAAYFDIYEFDGNEFKLVERRKNPYEKTLQRGKTYDVYEVIKDVHVTVSQLVGKRGIPRLKQKGLVLIFRKGIIEEILEEIRSDLRELLNNPNGAPLD